MDWRLTPWISLPEQNAVERGFKAAIADGYEGAVEGLGGFYGTLGRLAEEAVLYRSAAANTSAAELQVRYLIYAGDAYSEMHQLVQAEAMFLTAAKAAPVDPVPYQYLIEKVYLPAGNLAAAKAIVTRAIGSGAAPFSLYRALGEAAHLRGDDTQAEEALTAALDFRPNDFDVISLLGRLCLAQNRFNRAAFWMAKAVILRPRSAQTFHDLAVAEEGAYDYYAARRDYERAVALSPGDSNPRSHYQAFQRKAAKDGAAPFE